MEIQRLVFPEAWPFQLPLLLNRVGFKANGVGDLRPSAVGRAGAGVSAYIHKSLRRLGL